MKQRSRRGDQGSLELAQQAEITTGLELDAALGDCAYGTGPNRALPKLAWPKQRQVVEHRLARMVQLGMRQARYFGRDKTQA